MSDEEKEELEAYALKEAAALGMAESLTHWFDENPQGFSKSERDHITIWNSGLSWSTDLFVSAALRGIGYHVKTMPVPDQESLRRGKEFGNRGQCNPTYFTVGNLIKHLQSLEASGLSREEIIKNHTFLTAGACGPCRFGTYVTEYRKALRDAGFEGFRVVLFQQQGGLRQATGDDQGLELNPAFFRQLIKAFLAGDVVNLMAYRLRPYETTPGATNAALEEVRQLVIEALENSRSVLVALARGRRIFEAVEVDRLQPKPMVSVIGEFWAMTTEGDGNYHLQRFLEQEGAEVAIQPLVNWVLFIIWEQSRDTRRRMELRHDDQARKGLQGREPWKKLAMLQGAKVALIGLFRLFANTVGLRGYHLPDMNEIARISHEHYDNELRGGEGHMEVGKLIDSVEDHRAHMVISVKPFGCMPSSGVSDGVQSLIAAKYPQAIFLAIETSGDGEVNVQSRVQMMLFKAHQRAQAEFESVLNDCGLDREQAAKKLNRSWRARRTIHYPPHKLAGTAANQILEIA
ncbi:MAG: 2-hydroxyglutaryl-CoA dehydratase [Rickettsiales bacterium]|nr:2-hydroxyglutaryl-CoA dehydratase [Rickettsiales bacterium]